jgi:hypothetical protein
MGDGLIGWWLARGLLQNDAAAAAELMPEIRGNMGQCTDEHRGFKKAKERTWDRASLRKETLKNRKEARF